MSLHFGTDISKLPHLIELSEEHGRGIRVRFFGFSLGHFGVGVLHHEVTRPLTCHECGEEADFHCACDRGICSEHFYVTDDGVHLCKPCYDDLVEHCEAVAAKIKRFKKGAKEIAGRKR